eukprot:CAMPEP_0201518268 /NCGR_PEP_ID=MMETSP0161_2-20130828/9168_1 /ASSEMBLY_ACC=CAM_ASM_000251 /TAXON_ID=180227 /ORGANISM="Neoparamoeba aestuarina, Strain SoJaBio B1-5/56/2" /LENGTH=172 /DNA_ID=CAMNT_0047916005 /DNA_START=212 /DNA_END=730 /DNA_ORIENTATION=+
MTYPTGVDREGGSWWVLVGGNPKEYSTWPEGVEMGVDGGNTLTFGWELDGCWGPPSYVGNNHSADLSQGYQGKIKGVDKGDIGVLSVHNQWNGFYITYFISAFKALKPGDQYSLPAVNVSFTTLCDPGDTFDVNDGHVALSFWADFLTPNFNWGRYTVCSGGNTYTDGVEGH